MRIGNVGFMEEIVHAPRDLEDWGWCAIQKDEYIGIIYLEVDAL